MKRLVALDLSCNDFEGPIGRTIGSFRVIEYLRIHKNKFDGEIPVDYMASLNPYVRELYLQNNWFYDKVEDKERSERMATDKEDLEACFLECTVLI